MTTSGCWCQSRFDQGCRKSVTTLQTTKFRCSCGMQTTTAWSVRTGTLGQIGVGRNIIRVASMGGSISRDFRRQSTTVADCGDASRSQALPSECRLCEHIQFDLCSHCKAAVQHTVDSRCLATRGGRFEKTHCFEPLDEPRPQKNRFIAAK